MDAQLLYKLEVEPRKVGWGDSAFVHDEERGVLLPRRPLRPLP
jgi:hypothetical protein